MIAIASKNPAVGDPRVAHWLQRLWRLRARCVLATALVLAATPAAAATPIFVRPGGSDTLCNGTGDADDDGYCDAVEVQAGCNPHDGREIPAQPNVYAGGWQKFGEILLAYRAPNRRHIADSTDPSCTSTVGVCDPTTGFCTSGRVSDPCATNGQCNLPAHTCRVVINYAKTSDLRLLLARLQVRRQPSQNVTSLFSPATPGCSRKVDVPLPGGKRATLRLRASGTMNGRRWQDRDSFLYRTSCCDACPTPGNEPNCHTPPTTTSPSTTTTTTSTSTTTTSPPICANASLLAASCSDGTPCSSNTSCIPNNHFTCQDARVSCVPFCFDFHGGIGNVYDSPCVECGTGQVCQ